MSNVNTAMEKVPLNKALIKAKSYVKKGNLKEAKNLYVSILETFPKNKRAHNSLAKLKRIQKFTTAKAS